MWTEHFNELFCHRIIRIAFGFIEKKTLTLISSNSLKFETITELPNNYTWWHDALATY